MKNGTNEKQNEKKEVNSIKKDMFGFTELYCLALFSKHSQSNRMEQPQSIEEEYK